MNVTSTGLTRAAGVAAAIAGSIFVAVQVNHPAEAAYATETTEWVLRCSAKGVMSVLALVGIAGMYLRQHRQAGLLGLVGYVVFTLGYLTLFTVQVIAVAVLPTLLDSDPGYVMDVVNAAAGGTPDGDIGGMQVVLNVAGAGYILGGLLFNGLLPVATRESVVAVLDTVTHMFLNLIKMIIAPLIFATLVSGIAGAAKSAGVGKLFGRSMIWFLSASVLVGASS